MTSSKTSFPQRRLTDERGMTALGILVIYMTLIVIIILPLTVGILEYQLLQAENNQVKIAVENAVFHVFETVETQAFSRGTTALDSSAFQTVLEENLRRQNCSINPNDVTLDWVEDRYIVVTFDYNHTVKSIQLNKRMEVLLTYELPKDD